jgi:hypothetical protein
MLETVKLKQFQKKHITYLLKHNNSLESIPVVHTGSCITFLKNSLLYIIHFITIVKYSASSDKVKHCHFQAPSKNCTTQHEEQ